MAGTVKADVIQSELTTPTVFKNSSGTEIGQLTKSWMALNGAAQATVRGSFNLSSFTRSGQGIYSVSFTNAQASSVYCVNIATSGDQNTGTAGSPYQPPLYSSQGALGNLGALPTASGFGFGAGNWSSSGILDPTYMCLNVIR